MKFESVPPVTLKSLAVRVRRLSGTVIVSADVPPTFAKTGDALMLALGEYQVGFGRSDGYHVDGD